MNGAAPERLRAALAQVPSRLGDLVANAQRAVAAIASARDAGADLVVFPELSLTGYFVGLVDEDVALRADDPLLGELASAAGETTVVVGFVERDGARAYNSAAVLTGGRVAHIQRKLFLPTYDRWEERKHFSPGQALRTTSTRFGGLGVLICNDAWQPALAALSVQDGADVLVLPAASLADPPLVTPGGVADDWRLVTRFYARLLQAQVLFVNRAGEEAGHPFWGGSHAVGPDGAVLVEGPSDGEEALLLADLDLQSGRRLRRRFPRTREARLALLGREITRLIEAGGDL